MNELQTASAVWGALAGIGLYLLALNGVSWWKRYKAKVHERDLDTIATLWLPSENTGLMGDYRNDKAPYDWASE